MALNLVALALVLAITFMHSIFGFYSGLINLACCLVSLAVALGFYEPLTALIAGQFGLHTAYVEACSLLLLFLLSLTALRTAADNLIRGNVHVPQWLDTSGAVVCGFVNAQIIVGVLLLSVMMLPLGGRVLQFERFARDPGGSDELHPNLVDFDRRSIWTRSDDFAVGVFNLLSSGSMRGATEFQQVYPNFVDAVAFSGNTVQAESTPAAYRDDEADGFERGVRVEEWWERTEPIDVRYRREKPTADNRQPKYEPINNFKPADGYEFIGVRLKLLPGAADRSESGPAKHLFRPTMIRLVGTRRGATEQYPARIIVGADERIEGAPRLVDYDNNLAIQQAEAEIDVYFEVREGFRPRFVEYRRFARAALSGAPAESAPDERLAAAASEAAGATGASGGKFFGSVARGRATTAFPFSIARDRIRRAGGDVELDGNQFVKGRFFGRRERLETSNEADKLDGIKVPDGKRLVQLRYTPREARTLAGQVFNFVSGVTNQYEALDDRGNTYVMRGYYGIATRGSGQYIEFFFNGPEDDPYDPAYRGMLDFKELKPSELNDQEDAEIGLLFLVDAGVRVVRVQNQARDGADVNTSTPP